MFEMKWSILVNRVQESYLSGRVWKLGLAALIAIVAGQTVFAGDTCQNRKCVSPCSRSGLMLCCPDDYCRKPMPCVPCPRGCCPDTYCPKPIPSVPCPNACWYPDDYCRKPIPCLSWPPSPIRYSCGPCPSR
jgi:hypothetical protein